LTVIDASEEHEKISIWTGLLVLEELYGNKVKRLKIWFILKLNYF